MNDSLIDFITLALKSLLSCNTLASCIIDLKFSVDYDPNLIELTKEVALFIENIFQTRLTLVSSWDCFCHEDSILSIGTFINETWWNKNEFYDYAFSRVDPFCCHSSYMFVKINNFKSLKHTSKFIFQDNWLFYCKIIFWFGLVWFCSSLGKGILG